jgi:peptide deformylase
MTLPIVKYGHPALRQKGAVITSITPAIRQLIADMLETMYEHSGVGLAAQQVAQAVQLTVIDVREATDRPSTLELDGKPADVSAFMPLVLLNPVITPAGDPVAGSEGCLSFPEIYGDIIRPAVVDVSGLNGEGQPIRFRCGGLLARAVQHEADHLNGILFIDRMNRETRASLKPEIDELQAQTKQELQKASKRK